MNPLEIIKHYYSNNEKLLDILLQHSTNVANKAINISKAHPEYSMDETFIREASMIHDIGIFLCDAPSIFCTGKEPYICHGVLGAEIMRKEGFPKHALVCERHTGAGLSADMIAQNNLPLPHRDFLPISMEEKVICYADKFFSKTHVNEEKDYDSICRSLSKFGIDTYKRFEALSTLFS